ncbi:MAG: hypothetical protein ACRDY2_08590 [Acidimicrobiales bacterium]
MTALEERPKAVRRSPGRGGNHLPPGRYPPIGPSYDRRTAFDQDHERRDRHQRARTQRAIVRAVKRGTLPPLLATVLTQLLDLCTDTLVCPAPDDGPVCSGWWSLRFIHDLVLPALDVEGVPVPLEERNPLEGASTAGRWMRQLFALGWVDKIHRHRVVNGRQWGTSNLWRIQIPAEMRAELQGEEDASRSRNAERRHANGTRPGRTTPGRQGRNVPGYVAAQDQSAAAAAAERSQADQRHRDPCPACEGTRWVNHPNGTGSVRCAACKGSGTARAGP